MTASGVGRNSNHRAGSGTDKNVCATDPFSPAPLLGRRLSHTSALRGAAPGPTAERLRCLAGSGGRALDFCLRHRQIRHCTNPVGGLGQRDIPVTRPVFGRVRSNSATAPRSRLVDLQPAACWITRRLGGPRARFVRAHQRPDQDGSFRQGVIVGTEASDLPGHTDKRFGQVSCVGGKAYPYRSAMSSLRQMHPNV
jgi:hypothetical protein